MLGENEVRRRAAPISSAMEWNALLKIASSIGSVCADIDHHVEKPVYFNVTLGRNEGSRAVFRHDRRSLESVTSSELVPVVDKTRLPTSVRVYFFLCKHRLPAIGPLSLLFASGWELAPKNRSQAHRNDFQPPAAVGITVAAFMLSMETLGGIAIPVNGYLVPLPDIPEIGGTKAGSRFLACALAPAELFQVFEVLFELRVCWR